MSVQHIVESKYFKVVAITGGVFLVALFSFAVGVKVGFYKASFSARFGENYERNFLGGDFRDGRPPMPGLPLMPGLPPMPGFVRMMDLDDRGMRNPHGVAGEILSISGDTLVIKNPENQEISLRVNDKTIINRGKETLALSDLSVGENIIVVGKPGDDGTILARLIRVFTR